MRSNSQDCCGLDASPEVLLKGLPTAHRGWGVVEPLRGGIYVIRALSLKGTERSIFTVLLLPHCHEVGSFTTPCDPTTMTASSQSQEQQ